MLEKAVFLMLSTENINDCNLVVSKRKNPSYTWESMGHKNSSLGLCEISRNVAVILKSSQSTRTIMRI